MCVVCKHSESAHCLRGSVCPLVHAHSRPSRGALGRVSFLGCTLVSPVATKLPGRPWAWSLTPRPSFSGGFPHCTPPERVLSLLDCHFCHPLSFASLRCWDFFQQSSSAPVSDLASALSSSSHFSQMARSLYSLIHWANSG